MNYLLGDWHQQQDIKIEAIKGHCYNKRSRMHFSGSSYLLIDMFFC